MHPTRPAIRVVAFDVDGLLVDTEGSIQYEAWREPLQKRGKALSEEAYRKDYVGTDSRTLATKLITDLHISATPQELIEERSAEIHRLVRTAPIQAMPYAKEAITMVSNQGLILALATGGNAQETQIKLERSGLLRLISPLNPAIITHDDIPAGQGKPKPFTYQLVALRTNTDTAQIAAFEDSYPGYQAALGAGCAAFAIPTKWTDERFPPTDRRYASLRSATDALLRDYVLLPSRK